MENNYEIIDDETPTEMSISRSINNRLTKQTNTTRTKNNSISFGERLYRKSIAIQENKSKQIAEFKLQRDKGFKKEFLFKPKLNKDSCMITLRTKYSDSISRLSHPLSTTFSAIEKKEKKIESHREKREKEELSELKATCKRSSKEIEEICNKLYIQAERIKTIKQEETEKFYKEICPFAPKISNVSTPKIENFYTRLNSWLEKRNEKLSGNIEKSKIDPKTNKPLFRPVISEYKSNHKYSVNRNVFIDLFEENKKINTLRAESQRKYHEEINNLTKIQKISDKSLELEERNKFACFEKIFLFLSNSQELIEFDTNFEGKLNNLDSIIRNIFDPIKNHLQEEKGSLNKDEFFVVLEQLFSALNVDERRRIIEIVNKIKKSNSYKKGFSFSPSISKESNSIFNQTERFNKDLLERNNDHLRKKQDFIEKYQQKMIENQLKECTFHPSLLSSKSSKKSKK